MKQKLMMLLIAIVCTMQLFATGKKPFAARSIQVICHNMTNASFILLKTELSHGIPSHNDAANKDLNPPMNIVSHTVVSWQSESNGVMTGTEGYVSYKILDLKPGSNFYFHWNNPYASNAYGTHYNTFNESVSDGYIIYFTGNHRDYNEVVDLYIDYPKSNMVPGFLPSNNGFKFSNNNWSDFGYKLPSLQGFPGIENIKLGTASNGLCGGMVFAVRDYFEGKAIIPAMTSNPNDPENVYTKYIIKRLFNSFTTNDVTMYMKLMSPMYADTDEGVLNSMGQMGRAYVTLREEWPMIRADIDQGHPSTIGLIRVKSAWIGDLGQNHQVLVYGYTINNSSIDLRIYDPNFPSNNHLVIKIKVQGVDKPLSATYSGSSKPIYAIFRTNYAQDGSFPVYTSSRGVMRKLF